MTASLTRRLAVLIGAGAVAFAALTAAPAFAHLDYVERCRIALKRPPADSPFTLSGVQPWQSYGKPFDQAWFISRAHGSTQPTLTWTATAYRVSVTRSDCVVRYRYTNGFGRPEEVKLTVVAIDAGWPDNPPGHAHYTFTTERRVHQLDPFHEFTEFRIWKPVDN
jgi:hypothetical protein